LLPVPLIPAIPASERVTPCIRGFFTIFSNLMIIAMVASGQIFIMNKYAILVNAFTACWTITTAVAVLNQDAWQVGSTRQLRVCDARHPLCGGGASVPARAMLALQFYPPFSYSNLPPTDATPMLLRLARAPTENTSKYTP
jgi:hypothetical protein